jgi:hypothetical protein
VAHAVALALATARVGHFGECGKQDSEWHRATSKLEGRLHTAVTSARRRSRPGRYGRTEWPWSHRVTGGGHPPPVPTERGVRIYRTTLFGRCFTAPRAPAAPDEGAAVWAAVAGSVV